jgi:hypothetical protein
VPTERTVEIESNSRLYIGFKYFTEVRQGNPTTVCKESTSCGHDYKFVLGRVERRIYIVRNIDSPLDIEHEPAGRSSKYFSVYDQFSMNLYLDL